jgi:hypothetical protein
MRNFLINTRIAKKEFLTIKPVHVHGEQAHLRLSNRDFNKSVDTMLPTSQQLSLLSPPHDGNQN